MKNALIALGAVGFIAMVGFFLFKNRPQGHAPVKVMNPTYFDGVSKIGRVTSRRYYVEMKKAKLVVLGTSAFLRDSSLIWKEFLKASLVDGIQFDSVFSIEGLPQLVRNEQIVKDLPKLGQSSDRILIHVPSTEIWRERVNQAYPHADYIFFQAPFSMRDERRRELGLDCDNEADESFACLAYKAGTRYYRKKRTDNKPHCDDGAAGSKLLYFIYRREILSGHSI